jgi:hypothetical protein
MALVRITNIAWAPVVLFMKRLRKRIRTRSGEELVCTCWLTLYTAAVGLPMIPYIWKNRITDLMPSHYVSI